MDARELVEQIRVEHPRRSAEGIATSPWLQLVGLLCRHTAKDSSRRSLALAIGWHRQHDVSQRQGEEIPVLAARRPVEPHDLDVGEREEGPL